MSSESTAPAATKLITINDDDYRSTVTLQNLKKPDFKILLERLQNHADWKGLFPNDTAIDEWKDLKFWDPFISSTIEIIQECVANRDISKAKIRSLQRDLVQKEETLIENFSRENTSKIDPNHRRLAVLQMICRTLMDLLKEDMCKGVTNKISEVNIIIENAFTSSDTDVASLFPSERLLQSIYYVAGWHLGTVLKASTRRAGKMATIMKKFHFANFLSEDEAKKEKLPTDYVSGTQLFGGLNFVREKYFSFILRVEYIFVKCLTPEKLAIFGNEIMQILYSKLNASLTLRKEIIMLFDDDEIDNEENEDDISSFIRFLFRSYCRMRGKDYCRNIMSTSMDSTQKAHRAEIAIKSNSKTYKKKQKVEQEGKYGKLLVPKLKELLKSRKLKISGNKKDLIERLEDNDRETEEGKSKTEDGTKKDGTEIEIDETKFEETSEAIAFDADEDDSDSEF